MRGNGKISDYVFGIYLLILFLCSNPSLVSAQLKTDRTDISGPSLTMNNNNDESWRFESFFRKTVNNYSENSGSFNSGISDGIRLKIDNFSRTYQTDQRLLKEIACIGDNRKIRIMLKDSGLLTEGEFLKRDNEKIVVKNNYGEQDISINDISGIWVKGPSVKKGAKVGAIVGGIVTGLMVMSARNNPDFDAGELLKFGLMYYIPVAAIDGAIIGLFIHSWHKKYTREND